METERPRPDDEHNRIGYLNVDEDDASSERGAEEPDVADEIEHPERPGGRDD
jgi:hypothetical protein